VPVAIPLVSDQYEPYVLDSDTPYRFSHWLPNQPATPKNHEERVHLYRNYGAAIARFHRALVGYEDEDIQKRTWQTDLNKRVLDEAIPLILAHLSPDQRPSFEALLAEIGPGMLSAYANLPIQLIVWDCHPGNVPLTALTYADSSTATISRWRPGFWTWPISLSS
jgi:Ser/Thr protein kinase RdoA (MazF antagonist)